MGFTLPSIAVPLRPPLVLDHAKEEEEEAQSDAKRTSIRAISSKPLPF
jgi:hypothetical protein